jgi:hypothetical protein
VLLEIKAVLMTMTMTMTVTVTTHDDDDDDDDDDDAAASAADKEKDSHSVAPWGTTDQRESSAKAKIIKKDLDSLLDIESYFLDHQHERPPEHILNRFDRPSCNEGEFSQSFSS